MKYKMIITDMDDTLLRDDHTISERTKKAIKEAQEKGVKFVLASGRPTFAMRNYAKELELDKYGSYILSYNGAVITDAKENKEIFRNMLPKETVHELVELSKEHNMYIHTYLGDDIVTATPNEYTDIEQDITKMDIKVVDCLKSAVNEDVVKVLMLQEPEYLLNVKNKIKPLYEDRYSITISKPFFLEFMPHGVNKGNSLEKLLDILKIEKDEVVAIGDGLNDLEMLKVAGLPACVENANEELKKHAKVITKSNNEDGIAELIENYILN
ncbi:MAG: hypothetical protein PWP46_2199 [Fusobacteriaceae bacterium]|nr:hypothetical protein [Fusobacteriaceae bacterium]